MTAALKPASLLIDWLAVSWCVNGTQMAHLTYTEKQMVVRRLQHRMPAPSAPVRAGQLTAKNVGDLIGASKAAVEKIIARLPAAQAATCPVCRENCWRITDVVEPHPDRLNVECPMSGQALPDTAVAEWEALTAATILDMARALRAGDTTAVWSQVRWTATHRLRELLIAALAAVEPAGYEWLTEGAGA